MSELFDLMSSITCAHADMYRRLGPEQGRQLAEQIDVEMNQRIEAEGIPAKMIEDLELEQ